MVKKIQLEADAKLNDKYHITMADLTRNEVIKILAQAKIEGRIYKINLQGVRLAELNLSYLNFNHVNLRNADLRGANLSHAEICNADLRGADLRGTIFTGADLSFSDVGSARFGKWKSFPGREAKTDFGGADLKFTHYNGRRLHIEDLEDSITQDPEDVYAMP